MPSKSYGYSAGDVSSAEKGEPDHWQLREKRRRAIARHNGTGKKKRQHETAPDKVETVYPKSRKHPDDETKTITKDGVNSYKTGSVVTKGKWAGRRIRTLTLEERATCPRNCAQWTTCYGNNMPWAKRYAHGAPLEQALEAEIKALAAKRPLLIRLHILGDFYSRDYVDLWTRLAITEDIRIFGFSAHSPRTQIGRRLEHVRNTMWDKFAIRRSGGRPKEKGAVVIDAPEQAAKHDAIVCPAQLGQTDNCGTCGLCWQSTRNIAFLKH